MGENLFQSGHVLDCRVRDGQLEREDYSRIMVSLAGWLVS